MKRRTREGGLRRGLWRGGARGGDGARRQPPPWRQATYALQPAAHAADAANEAETGGGWQDEVEEVLGATWTQYPGTKMFNKTNSRPLPVVTVGFLETLF
eukprot:3876581-Rhodomonas_salina.5